MKAVFLGPISEGRSVLLNRILGVELDPDLVIGDYITRNVLTYRNVVGASFRLTMECVPQVDLDEILCGVDEARILYYACTDDHELVSDDVLKSWMASTPSPWLPLYSSTVAMVADMALVEYESMDAIFDALLDMMVESALELFVDNIIVEGHFPILGQGGSLVDMPYCGYATRVDVLTINELASATHAFYVTEDTSEALGDDLLAFGSLLPRGTPLNVYTLNAKGVERAPVEIYSEGLATSEHGENSRKVALLTNESNEANETVAVELIEFIKTEGRRKLIKV